MCHGVRGIHGNSGILESVTVENCAALATWVPFPPIHSPGPRTLGGHQPEGTQVCCADASARFRDVGPRRSRGQKGRETKVMCTGLLNRCVRCRVGRLSWATTVAPAEALRPGGNIDADRRVPVTRSV